MTRYVKITATGKQGTGKTVLLEKIVALLETEGIPAVKIGWTWGDEDVEHSVTFDTTAMTHDGKLTLFEGDSE